MESARQYKGSRIDYDPLVKEGYTYKEVEDTVDYCEEQGYLLSNKKGPESNELLPSKAKGWWRRGLTKKGGTFLNEDHSDYTTIEADYI